MVFFLRYFWLRFWGLKINLPCCFCKKSLQLFSQFFGSFPFSSEIIQSQPPEKFLRMTLDDFSAQILVKNHIKKPCPVPYSTFSHFAVEVFVLPWGDAFFRVSLESRISARFDFFRACNLQALWLVFHLNECTWLITLWIIKWIGRPRDFEKWAKGWDL